MKTQNMFGTVTDRGPHNRAFIEYGNKMSGLLSTHFQNGGSASLSELSNLVSSSIQDIDVTDSNGNDLRSVITDLLTNYTDSLLKNQGLVSTGDKGLIKVSKSQSYFSTDTSFTLKSKKSEFLRSDLYQSYAQQFDHIAPALEQRINQTLESGLKQGQAGKLRDIVKNLKGRPKKWMSETLSFKKQVATNRLKSLFSSESVSDQKELYDTFNKAQKRADSMIGSPKNPEDMASDYRNQLNDADATSTDQINSTAISSKQAIDDMNKQMSVIQSHMDHLLNSDINQKLLNIQGSFNSDGTGLDQAATDLKQSVSSVESELTALKNILVSAGHVALDHVDDILMSVPYLGELYSAMAVANDIQGGYFASQKMDAMKTQIDRVTGFNRYIASNSLQSDQVSGNVEAFSCFMKSEQKRDAAAFSLLVHVGNALSPPGVNVGSVLKAVKDVVNLPELTDSDMNNISKEVMTVNQHYKELAQTTKSDGLNTVIDSLGTGKLDDFTTAVFDVSFHLPTANDFTQTLNQQLFN